MSAERKYFVHLRDPLLTADFVVSCGCSGVSPTADERHTCRDLPRTSPFTHSGGKHNKMVSSSDDRGEGVALALDGAGVAFVGGNILVEDPDVSDEFHIAALDTETGQV